MPSPVPPPRDRSPSLARPALHPVRQRLLQWIRWFGVARLATAAVATVLLGVGALWVVRVPPPSTAAVPGDPVPSASQALAHGSGDVAVPMVTLVGSPVSTPPTQIVVHVSGAVNDPGVHEIEAGSRVIAAVAAAGGAHADAELDAVNLAAPLADGQRVYVPAAGEEFDPSTRFDGGIAVDAEPRPVDVNRAPAEELERLPGVGPAIATAIVEDRDRNGPFTSVEQLVRVSGIGPAKLAAIAPLVTL